jgi:hypothetical protein
MARQGYRLERLDRWLGTMLSRACGTLFAIAGVAALWSVLTLDDFTLAEYWPVLAMAAVMLGASWLCFRGRPSFLEMMSETPLSRSEAAARRGDVPVDDQGRGEDQG